MISHRLRHRRLHLRPLRVRRAAARPRVGHVAEPEESGSTSFVGTREYMAPEVIKRTGHGVGVDWWSLGMVLYEMLTGLPPWYTNDRQKLFQRLRHARLNFPLYVSRPAVSLIRGLLTRNPAERMGGRDELRGVASSRRRV